MRDDQNNRYIIYIEYKGNSTGFDLIGQYIIDQSKFSTSGYDDNFTNIYGQWGSSNLWKELIEDHLNSKQSTKVQKFLLEGERFKPTFSTLKLIIYFTFIFAIALVIGGIFLIYLGSSGSTEFSFFGQKFKSTNIGIASFFMGAVIIAMNFRRVLTHLDRLIRKR